MNKLQKQLVKIGVTGCTLLSTIAGVGAASISFSQNIKPFQQGGTLPSATKSSSSGYGTIRLSSLSVDSVTFNLVSSQGTGVALTYNKTLVGQTLNIYYNGTAYQGSTVSANFRNHNWTANAGTMVGILDYK